MTSAIASANTLDLSPFPPSIPAGQERRVSESIRLAAVTDRSEDITFTTRDGDTVTLFMDQSTAALYGRDGRISQIRQLAADADGVQTVDERLAGETREWFGIESSREFTLSVEGDLSREEIQDIRKALRRIHQLVGSTFDAQNASIRRGPSLTGLDTLSGIAVDIQESRVIMAARTTRASTLAYGTGGQTHRSRTHFRHPNHRIGRRPPTKRWAWWRKPESPHSILPARWSIFSVTGAGKCNGAIGPSPPWCG